ncbi:MAG: hypothetical protein ACYS21_20280 [Planctomycetota bacterium]
MGRFNRGSKDALRRIYEKYKDDLLGLAVTLLRDRSVAEDIVHDVFLIRAKLRHLPSQRHTERVSFDMRRQRRP